MLIWFKNTFRLVIVSSDNMEGKGFINYSQVVIERCFRIFGELSFCPSLLHGQWVSSVVAKLKVLTFLLAPQNGRDEDGENSQRWRKLNFTCVKCHVWADGAIWLKAPEQPGQDILRSAHWAHCFNWQHVVPHPSLRDGSHAVDHQLRDLPSVGEEHG